jgi:hypothetical protein
MMSIHCYITNVSAKMSTPTVIMKSKNSLTMKRFESSKASSKQQSEEKKGRIYGSDCVSHNGEILTTNLVMVLGRNVSLV